MYTRYSTMAAAAMLSTCWTAPASALPPDLHYAALTTVFEAGGEDIHGQAAVLATINNRVACGYGSTIRDVVTHHKGKRYAFEVWGNVAKRSQMVKLSEEDWRYQKALWLAGLVWNGKYQDPTGGATHYWSPSVQASFGRKSPVWASQYEMTTQIGKHWFYKGPCRPEGASLHLASARSGEASDEPPAPIGHSGYKSARDRKEAALRGFFVQVGAYKDAGKAGKAAATVKQQFAAQIGKHPVFAINSNLDGHSGGEWHHVLIGPMASKGAAAAMCRHLSDTKMEKTTGRVCFVWGSK